VVICVYVWSYVCVAAVYKDIVLRKLLDMFFLFVLCFRVFVCVSVCLSGYMRVCMVICVYVCFVSYS
jgi:hypothetical protein